MVDYGISAAIEATLPAPLFIFAAAMEKRPEGYVAKPGRPEWRRLTRSPGCSQKHRLL
jgi:hypothetical protein